jgi:hypothetical protein
MTKMTVLNPPWLSNAESICLLRIDFITPVLIFLGSYEYEIVIS